MAKQIKKVVAQPVVAQPANTTKIISEKEMVALLHQTLDQAPVVGHWLLVPFKRGEEKTNARLNGSTIGNAISEARTWIQQGWLPA